MQRPFVQSRLITWFLWLHIARICRVKLLLNEVERLKWCAGDQIRNFAVKDRDVLNAGDWDRYRVLGGHRACATTLPE